MQNWYFEEAQRASIHGPKAQPWARGELISSGLSGRDTSKPMPQSLSRVLVHMVFSTKHRASILTPGIHAELHPYLATVLTNKDCPSLRVGGVEDHVHLFFGLSRTLTVAQVAETVKTSSSKWIKTKSKEFSISPAVGPGSRIARR